MTFEEFVVGMHAMVESVTGRPCQCRVCREFNDRIKNGR